MIRKRPWGVLWIVRGGWSSILVVASSLHPQTSSPFILYSNHPQMVGLWRFSTLWWFFFFPIRYEMIINDIPCFDHLNHQKPASVGVWHQPKTRMTCDHWMAGRRNRHGELVEQPTTGKIKLEKKITNVVSKSKGATSYCTPSYCISISWEAWLINQWIGKKHKLWVCQRENGVQPIFTRRNDLEQPVKRWNNNLPPSKILVFYLFGGCYMEVSIVMGVTLNYPSMDFPWNQPSSDF